MTKIKMCGLKRMTDILHVNEIQPEYAGFVFAKTSKRYVEPEDAEVFRKALSPDIEVVGVFVDEPVSNVIDLLKREVIDIAQLHGSEDVEYIARVKEETGKQVIKVIRMEAMFRKGRTLTEEMAEYPGSDYFLIDSGAGSGRTFDWNLLKGIDRPYFLAGGLNPDNVREAVTKLHPYCVDVSSGIESGGQKDKNKMVAFADAVRRN
ncbi:MAG: phosphoribosylanthranilate isomerase [Lachnospiraceae bacterium]|nr:phosphoribosylanthranilate isomerase [Lachnospiraceae bacterium]